jgi:hypothetical protein
MSNKNKQKNKIMRDHKYCWWDIYSEVYLGVLEYTIDEGMFLTPKSTLTVKVHTGSTSLL